MKLQQLNTWFHKAKPSGFIPGKQAQVFAKQFFDDILDALTVPMIRTYLQEVQQVQQFDSADAEFFHIMCYNYLLDALAKHKQQDASLETLFQEQMAEFIVNQCLNKCKAQADVLDLSAIQQQACFFISKYASLPEYPQAAATIFIYVDNTLKGSETVYAVHAMIQVAAHLLENAQLEPVALFQVVFANFEKWPEKYRKLALSVLFAPCCALGTVESRRERLQVIIVCIYIQNFKRWYGIKSKFGPRKNPTSMMKPMACWCNYWTNILSEQKRDNFFVICAAMLIFGK